jgi:neutral ceramidase
MQFSRFRCWMPLLIAVVVFFQTAPGMYAGAKKVFKAGAYAQDVTPKKFPISVNGGMSDRQAKGTHDPLHARCLALDDGTTRIVLVVVDSCMIPREVTDEAKRLAEKATGIPPARILISATHTHTAPTVTGVFQSDPNEPYRKYLAQKIAAGIKTAVDNLEPARIGWGVGKNPDQLFNRRWFMTKDSVNLDPFSKTTDKVRMNPGYKNPGLDKPAGPINPDVSVLSVQSLDGRPIGLLANYCLHYVGGVEPLSADYFGAFADRMTQLLKASEGKPGFVAIMSNGTSGDINNVNYGGPAPPKYEPYEKIRIVANSVADTAFETYQKIEHKDWVSLAMAQKEIELAVRLPNAEDIKRAEDLLAQAKGPLLKTREEIYARETVLLAKYPPKVKVILQAIRIGDLGIVSTPCETFVEIGLEIKKKSPLKHTFTIELANGYNGYLPTPQQHSWGGYETWRARSSYLEVNASVAITRTLLDLLSEVTK